MLRLFTIGADTHGHNHGHKAHQFSYLSRFCLQDGFVKGILQKPSPLCVPASGGSQGEKERFVMLKVQGKKEQFNTNALLCP